jgi:hypothetical protein
MVTAIADRESDL